MKLLNLEDQSPEEYFIFVNQYSPFTYHNFNLTGHFVSAAFGSIDTDSEFLPKYLKGTATYLPFQAAEMDCKTASPYSLTAINDYRIETDAERFRLQHHPLYPSRMSAIYAFGDFETCKAVSKKYGWDINSVRRFKLKDHPLNRVIRVNMEQISLYRMAYRHSILHNVFSLWESYWNGSGSVIMELPSAGFKTKRFESDVIWEYLIEGVVEHLDHKVKNKRDLSSIE